MLSTLSAPAERYRVHREQVARRNRLRAELASYRTPSERADLEAMLSRHTPAEVAELEALIR